MQIPDDNRVTAHQTSSLPVPLQLLLFVDERSRTQEPMRRIQNYLLRLQQDNAFGLQVIGVEKQPHLAEHYRIVATPSLVRIWPPPRQTLAGLNLLSQLESCWDTWLQAAWDHRDEDDPETERGALLGSVKRSAEWIRLSDEIFRLQRENEELVEQLRFKDQILAMLAHDLRNPLTAAAIAFETLELAEKNGSDTDSNGTNDASRSRQLLQRQIYKQAQNQFRIMNRMIADILETAKGKSAGLQIQPQRVYLQHLCEDVLQQFDSAFRAKSLNVHRDIPQDLPAAYADEELTRQVLVNLLDNAVKYTPESGEVYLSALHRTTQKIQVSVCDSGPGIPSENQDHIFEGHVRLERDVAKDGYGLGLSLCRQVVRAHYGRIWVDSAPDRGGSCFHFTLPTYQGRPGAS
ncbi:His Kinase A (phosphoacceptor) domain/KaiB domain/Histidine kinase-like ATPase [Rubidibacter lacunae KORDI 51-2]|uniref:Adaptive-response sensory-kinase SasA n=1 Tax=Rubidibacter lacunae KORDI 51-2 TaxID=582515 RepID=U5DJK1_9CHRO|nr:histidine kinase [Rubidibacter lacunae]ERN41082.1 His Kinase A (phosphoacceptor) domain/KaiB domain/Histidine kinase-like ATPase [Rubidibacter lacunae KORDI 51-2]